MKMTSDAKIGLLLGLIFIFIIAFILNGLPGLHGKGGSNQATAEDLSNLSSSSVDAAPVQPGGVASSLGAPAGSGNDEVRYKISLGTPAKSGDTSVAPAGTTPAPLCDANAAPKVASKDTKDNMVDLSSPAPKPVVDMVASAQPDGSAGIESTAVEAPKADEYTIASGDSPARIAVKAYGAKEGVKPANVNKIMAANKIKDPTKLKPGMKLTIPALPTGPEKLTVTNPEAFSKVEKLSTATAPKSDAKTNPDVKPEVKTLAPKADVKTDPDAKPAVKAGKEYTVASGDNLWKIAAKTLGDGNRYKEIVKLNTGKLGKDGTKLAVGMKLQIPAK
jgi:nucleoid-associated protein YgaU